MLGGEVVERWWRGGGAQTNIKTLGPAPFITANLQFIVVYLPHLVGVEVAFVPHSNNRLTIHFAGLVNPIIAA